MAFIQDRNNDADFKGWFRDTRLNMVNPADFSALCQLILNGKDCGILAPISKYAPSALSLYRDSGRCAGWPGVDVRRVRQR
jgi:hypothetical protein